MQVLVAAHVSWVTAVLSYLCLCLYMASSHSLCLHLLCISQKDTSHWSEALEDFISRIFPIVILNDIDKDSSQVKLNPGVAGAQEWGGVLFIPLWIFDALSSYDTPEHMRKAPCNLCD